MTIVRSFVRPVERRPTGGTLEDVADWLLGAAREIEDTAELFDELCWRLIAAGLPVARATLHMRTIHPLFLSFGCRWRRATGRTDEVGAAHGALEMPVYRDSPIRLVFEERQIVRRRLAGSGAMDFPILDELRAEAFTDYLAVPIAFSIGRVHAMTWASDQPGGFGGDDIANLTALAPRLSPLLEIHSLRRVTTNLLDAYLGRLAGARVLKGEILRGRGEAIRAVIWSSDLREFTRLSDRLPGARVIEILNACFEQVVRPIEAHGGEVLKFIGDGLLAIFTVPDAALAFDAARRALIAAREALANIDTLNARGLMGGEPPIKMAVALHLGEIYFGNIGAPDRLDFTAIGPAVNLVARLEKFSKQVQRSLLVTEEFARAAGRKFESLGVHPLRGVSEPVEVFTVPDA
jgi:adenylate cyclase